MKQGDMVTVYLNDLSKMTGEFRGWDVCPHTERPILIMINDANGNPTDIDKDDIKGIGSKR